MISFVLFYTSVAFLGLILRFAVLNWCWVIRILLIWHVNFIRLCFYSCMFFFFNFFFYVFDLYIPVRRFFLELMRWVYYSSIFLLCVCDFLCSEAEDRWWTSSCMDSSYQHICHHISRGILPGHWEARETDDGFYIRMHVHAWIGKIDRVHHRRT